MSLHGHQYWDGFSDSGQMAPAPLLSWLNNFPGDISATGVIPIWGVCESSSFCSRCPSSHSKAQLTASIYESSLDCLLWTPSTLYSLSSSHPSLSCKLLRLPLSLSKLSQLSPGGFIYTALAVWQYILCCSHLQPDDTPLTVSFHINKVLMISSFPQHFFNEVLKLSASSEVLVL